MLVSAVQIFHAKFTLYQSAFPCLLSYTSCCSLQLYTITKKDLHFSIIKCFYGFESILFLSETFIHSLLFDFTAKENWRLFQDRYVTVKWNQLRFEEVCTSFDCSVWSVLLYTEYLIVRFQKPLGPLFKPNGSFSRLKYFRIISGVISICLKHTQK